MLPFAASSMSAFDSSSVSLSPKKLPLSDRTVMLRTSLRRTATDYLPRSDGTRLRKTGDRLLFVRIGVEHVRELGDHEDVLDARVHGAQLHVAAASCVVRVGGDQHAESGRVEVL